MAANYYGVPHPSEPNYVAAISGLNWGRNVDDPSLVYDHLNIVDELESHHLSWAAHMESMPSAGYTGQQYPASAALYANKHNPFVLFQDVLSSPARLAKIRTSATTCTAASIRRSPRTGATERRAPTGRRRTTRMTHRSNRRPTRS